MKRKRTISLDKKPKRIARAKKHRMQCDGNEKRELRDCEMKLLNPPDRKRLDAKRLLKIRKTPAQLWQDDYRLALQRPWDSATWQLCFNDSYRLACANVHCNGRVYYLIAIPNANLLLCITLRSKLRSAV